MAKYYYTDFVTHVMRFYIKRDDSATFRNKCDELNYNACKLALNDFSADEVGIITSIYESGCDMNTSVIITSKRKRVRPKAIWSLISKFERKVAENRGLI